MTRSIGEDVGTPISSASSYREEPSHKRQKLEHFATNGNSHVDKPVFLKLSFKKPGEVDEPDPLIEDDATFNARPWQEKSTVVPLLIAFRNQFSELFDGVPDFGPQDLEEGIESDEPSSEVQEFMCRLLTLAANRARPVEHPHYNRPLNDCVAAFYATRGDPAWEGQNPLASNKRFPELSADDRLRLMQCLLDWSLTESKAVRDRIEDAYKNRTAPRIQTHNPYELNVIGRDDKKHGYYLLKGKNTRFRLYVETDHMQTPVRWYSICSTLEELRLYTARLSDTARTVRCRKIVDDLASIHIPEVERAEDARKQILLRKQRALQERTRRAAYASDQHDTHFERSTRTRGRRVDYNSMLEGQGDEDDNKSLSYRDARFLTPESATPLSSRSGRTIKKPRGLDDDSPEPDFWKIVPNHASEPLKRSKSSEGTEEHSDASHIVILTYNKEIFRNWVHKPWASIPLPVDTPFQKRQKAIDSVVVPEPLSEEQQSLAKLYGPLIAAQMIATKKHISATTASASATVDVSNSSKSQESPTIPDPQTTLSNDRLSTHEQNASNNESCSDTLKEERDHRVVVATKAQIPARTAHATRSLVLATLRQPIFSIASISSILSDVVQRSTQMNLSTLDILLYATPEVLQSWAGFHSDAFLQVQKTISELYIYTAKLCRQLNTDLETTVTFADWSGYDLAKEDLEWGILGSNMNDRSLVDNFLRVHKDHYNDRVDPVVLQVSSVPSHDLHAATSSSEQAPRRYNVVAVGGTFDHLHAGHKILLTMTAWLAQEKVVCGITGDALLVNKKHKEVMEDIAERTRHVREFYHRLKRGINYELVPIEDVAGPTGTDPTIQALVASRETEAGSAQIKEIRQNQQLPPLDILFIDVIGQEGEVHGDQMAQLKLSSTEIRQRLASKI